jgi:hypothetical protein
MVLKKRHYINTVVSPVNIREILCSNLDFDVSGFRSFSSVPPHEKLDAERSRFASFLIRRSLSFCKSTVVTCEVGEVLLNKASSSL